MRNKRTENWELSDFGRHFRHAAEKSSVEEFKQAFGALAGELAPLDSEFCRETAACGRKTVAAVEELASIAGRMGYCDHSRGFAGECEDLYADADRVRRQMAEMRETCYL